jgi:hypothetical protein
METLTGRFGFTVIVTVLEVAGLPVLQARFDVMITYTWSPSAGINEYVAPVPAKTAFLNHSYDGVPPFTGAGVKVTDVPAHTLLAEGSIETLTSGFGFTTMMIVFEVAGLPSLQIRSEVIIT